MHYADLSSLVEGKRVMEWNSEKALKKELISSLDQDQFSIPSFSHNRKLILNKIDEGLTYKKQWFDCKNSNSISLFHFSTILHNFIIVWQLLLNNFTILPPLNRSYKNFGSKFYVHLFLPLICYTLDINHARESKNFGLEFNFITRNTHWLQMKNRE